jgi:hypothetical protein
MRHELELGGITTTFPPAGDIAPVLTSPVTHWKRARPCPMSTVFVGWPRWSTKSAIDRPIHALSVDFKGSCLGPAQPNSAAMTSSAVKILAKECILAPTSVPARNDLTERMHVKLSTARRADIPSAVGAKIGAYIERYISIPQCTIYHCISGRVRRAAPCEGQQCVPTSIVAYTSLALEWPSNQTSLTFSRAGSKWRKRGRGSLTRSAKQRPGKSIVLT